MTLWQDLRDIWTGDAAASDLAMQGEHRLAQGRVTLIAALTALGLAVVAREPQHRSYVQAVPVNLTCLALAVAALFITRRGVRPTWLAAATAAGDVTLVSVLHLLDLLNAAPSVAVNGRITFVGYFFALLGTCVRWDRRIAIGAGLLAAAQYGGIVIVARAMWPAAVTADVLEFGQFDGGVQVERVLVLALFGIACGSIVEWAVRLRTHATTDPLTGLMNRRTFSERMRDELLRANRQQRDVSIVMVDLDHFKDVNDRHGHDAGDHVLRTVAGLLQQTVRRTDFVSRWGGEEFVIAYLDTTHDAAARAAEELRAAVSTRSLALPNGTPITVTLSAGVASATLDGFNLDALLLTADRHLLQAKGDGRNRVSGSGASPAS